MCTDNRPDTVKRLERACVHFGRRLSLITSNRNMATLEIKKPGEQQKEEEVVRLSTDTLDFLY